MIIPLYIHRNFHKRALQGCPVPGELLLFQEKLRAREQRVCEREQDLVTREKRVADREVGHGMEVVAVAYWCCRWCGSTMIRFGTYLIHGFITYVLYINGCRGPVCLS